MSAVENHLKDELYSRVRADHSIFTFLQEATLDGLWYWDLESPEYEWMSPEFWELLGHDPAEKRHLSSEWQDIINPDDLEVAQENLAKHLADSNHPYDQVVRYRHKKGQIVWVRCRGIALRDASGNPVRMLGAHSDVTALKHAEAELKENQQALQTALADAERLSAAKTRAEQSLQQAYSELEQRVADRTADLTRSNAALEQEIADRRRVEESLRQQRGELAHVLRGATVNELTGALAHELNQPLTAIRSNAEAGKRLMRTNKPDLNEIREILDDIADDDRRAAEVIRRMRNMLKKQEVEAEPLDMNEIVREVTGLVHSDAVVRNILVDADLADGLPEVLGDRVQLQQVCLNLILNGFDAMQEVPVNDKTLVVQTTAQAEKAVCVSVRDNGVGFSKTRSDDLFTPFHTTKPDGLGMGLPICKSIVEAHGGTITGLENPDGGVTFQFTVPVA